MCLGLILCVLLCVCCLCVCACVDETAKQKQTPKQEKSIDGITVSCSTKRHGLVDSRLVSFVIDFKGTPPSRPRNSRHSNRDASGSQEGREGGQQEGRGGTWRDYLQVRGVAHVHGHGANQEPVEDILRDVVRVSFSALGPSAAPSAHCSSVLSTRKEPTLREGVESKQVIHEATGATGGNQI